jgi:hypothetical protein
MEISSLHYAYILVKNTYGIMTKRSLKLITLVPTWTHYAMDVKGYKYVGAMIT